MQPSPARARMIVAESNLRGVRGLTLDAFGSLLEGGPERVPSVLSSIAAKRGETPDVLALRDLWQNALRRHIRSDPFLAFREVHRRAFQDVFETLGIRHEVATCVEATFDEYRAAKAYPDVSDVLRELERDVPLAVVSNMDTGALLAALLANGLSFTFVVTSDEEQRYKPDPSLFRRAVRYLGLPAAHILHVGDSYPEDIVGASLVGMPSLLIRRGDGPGAPPTGVVVPMVRSLSEVRDFIRKSRQEN